MNQNGRFNVFINRMVPSKGFLRWDIISEKPVLCKRGEVPKIEAYGKQTKTELKKEWENS